MSILYTINAYLENRSLETSSPAFSNDGSWIYLNSNIGQLRVHVPDLNYQYVAPRLTTAYSVSSAVSNGGRYVVSSARDKPLTIYDTTNCSADTSIGCAKRELYTLARAEYAKTLPSGVGLGEFSVVGVKFVNDAKLELYAWTTWTDGKAKYIKFDLSVDPGPQATRYLALGDSFSSGEGALSYRAGTNFYVDQSNFNFCHQSTVSYPYLLNKSLSTDWFGDAACSGATMNDIINSDEKAYMESYSQARGLGDISYDERIFAGMLPGYRTQLSFISKYNPTVATISIGGNDVGFGDIVTQCVTQKYTGGGNCFSEGVSRDWLASTIDQKIPLLTSTFKTLKNSLSGEQKLYVVGYPQVVNPATPSTVCNLNVQMTFEERTFASNLIDYLNEAVRLAANNAGAKYVDVSTAFYDSDKDYRLCGNQNITAVNGLIAGLPGDDSIKYTLNKKPDEIAYHESYHPNELGHILLSRQIRAMTNDFMLSMPGQTPAQAMKVDDVFRARLVGYTSSAYDNSVHIKQEVVDNIVQSNTSFSAKIDTSATLLPALGSKAKIEIHSTPVVLGEVPINPSGITIANVVIPASVPLGPHELHIYYPDLSGRMVDVYQYIYVVHSLDDYDGNGIANSQEKCLVVPASGVDSDGDGIDDACDGEYITMPKSDAQLIVDEGSFLITQAEATGAISNKEATDALTQVIDAASNNNKENVIASNETRVPTNEPIVQEVLGQSLNPANPERGDVVLRYIVWVCVGVAFLLFGICGIYFYKRHKHNLNHKGSARE